MAFPPKIKEIDVRQVVASDYLLKLQRSAIGLFAVELGLDPIKVLELDYGRFSARNNFHVLASDARALGTYVMSTGLDIPVTELAAHLRMPKQIISRLVHRGEDLRDNAVAARVIERVEYIFGVGAP
jgi:hypothetical protein